MDRMLPQFFRRALPGLLACWLAGHCLAAPQVFSGKLDDAGNAALVDSSLQAPSFSDPYNNVALYALSIAQAGNVSLTSTGFASGGIDPYVTLFSGLGLGATFLASNYDNAFLGPGGDFVITLALAAGDYQLVIGAFANMSFAENLGSGTLGDGFIGLGGAFPEHDAGYRLIVDAQAGNGGSNVPEPQGLALLALAALAGVRRKA